MKKFCPVFLSILLVFASGPGFAAEDLVIRDWQINSSLQKNGDLIVVEDLTFDFNDSFNGVYRSIVLERIDGIKDLKVSLLRQGEEEPFSLVESAKNGDSHVFTVKEDRKNLEIKIFSPSKGEKKTFRLHYIVRNLAVHQIDTGEVYYKFIGRENKTPIDSLSINISLPYGDREETKIFAHGPPQGNIEFVRDDLINLKVDNLASDTFVEARILFPRYFIGDSPNTENNTKENIIREEARLVRDLEEKALSRERKGSLWSKTSLFLAGLGLVFFSFFFNKLRRRGEALDDLRTGRLEDISPGELRLFYYSIVDGRSLMTMVFDLVRKDYIEIQEIESNKKKKRDFSFVKINKSQTGLLSHEKYLLDWLFNTIGDGRSLTTRDIEKYRKKNYSGYYKSLSKLQKLTKEDLDKRNYMDPKGKTYGGIVLLLALVLIAGSIISLAFGSFHGLIPLFLGVILSVYSIILFTRRSDKGFVQYELWKRLKKDLEKDFRGQDVLAIAQDKILIYGLALGLPMKSMEKLREPVSLYSSSSNWAYWYFLTNSRGGSSFEDSFNSSFYGNTSGSTSSSSIGGGGGFSSGGGGGAGGGGAGGF